MTVGSGVKSEGVVEEECDWVHGPRTSSPDRKSEGVMEEECDWVYGPRTSSPDRGSLCMLAGIKYGDFVV